jgi:hypothetical protein
MTIDSFIRERRGEWNARPANGSFYLPAAGAGMKSRVEMGRDPVHFSTVIARAASRPQSLLPVAAASLLVIAGLVALLFASKPYVWAGPAASEPYNLVVAGFREGHVWLAKDAPPALLHAPNPYDFATYRPYLSSPWGLTDLSYYEGHLYAYFGVTPAVILFWPFRTLTGHWLHQAIGVLVFSVLGYVVCVGLAVAARRRYFPRTSVVSEAAIALLLGSVTTLPVFMARPGLYEVSISCGFAFTMLALAALWNAWHSGSGKSAWLAAASLLFGLAVGSRPSLLFGSSVLFLPAAAALWVAIRSRTPGRWFSYFLATLLPLSAVGVGLAAYNFHRFGDAFQFGHDYQLSGNDVYGTSSFAPRFFWDNFRLYFLEPLRWHAAFPFVWRPATPTLVAGHLPVEFFFGTLVTFPVLIAAALVPLAWNGARSSTDAARELPWASAVLVVLFLTAALPICCYAGATSRYMVDFIPSLALLAALGFLALERVSGIQAEPVAPVGGIVPIARGALRVALVYSTAVAWLLAIALCSFYRGAEKGMSILKGEGIEEGIAHYERLCRINPDFRSHAELMIGIVLLEKGRAAQGISYLNAAVEEDPGFAAAHFDLGEAQLSQGHFAEAASAFGKAAALDRFDGVAESQLGIALFRQGRVAEAIDHEKAAVRIQPTLDSARANLAAFEAAAPKN